MNDFDYFKYSGRSSKRFFWAICFSLVVHFIILNFQFDIFSEKSLEGVSDKKLEVALWDKKDIATLINSIKRKNSFKRQVVNNEEAGSDIKPIDSRFLGERDQTYRRQTIARQVDKFKVAGRGTRDGGKSKKIKLTDLSITEKDSIFALEKDEIVEIAALGLVNGKQGETGPASNNDYIEDVPLGDFTHLNTTEFKYYGFYNRIRLKLEQYWGNSLRDKMDYLHKSGRRFPASDNLITALIVTIDSKGQIVNVFLKNTSGIRELDEAAIESFNRAGPFPNPPKGMIRKNGTAKIEWGFVVKA